MIQPATNPGLKTLISILKQIKTHQPVTFYQLSLLRNRAYGLVTRYLKFCLKAGLIQIQSQQKTRGPRLSKRYALTEKGETLLQIFEGENL